MNERSTLIDISCHFFAGLSSCFFGTRYEKVDIADNGKDKKILHKAPEAGCVMWNTSEGHLD